MSRSSRLRRRGSWSRRCSRPRVGIRLAEVVLDSKLLDILACPVCKGPLRWHRDSQQLVCRGDRLAFQVSDGIPVMLEDEARTLAADDPLLQD